MTRLAPALAALSVVWLFAGRGWALAMLVAVLSALWLSRGDTRTGRGRQRWSRVQRDLALRRAGYQCEDCGSGYELELDHVVPWSRGGDHHLSNVRVLCGPCNRRKGALPPEEYYQ